jgi:DNA-binding CsgD family transcriptional regulator
MKTQLNHKCYNPKHQSYHLFGAKGITICDVWRNGARDMYDWAKSQGWEEGDVFCLREGQKEFNPTTVFILKENEFHSEVGLKRGFQITYKGETHSVRKWAELLGVDATILKKKILKYPSIDRAFKSKFRKSKFVRDPSLAKKVIKLYESGKTQQEIAKIIGQFPQNVRYHLVKNGIQLRSEDKKKHKRADIRDEDIIRLLGKGIPKNSIAEILGCSWPTIDRRCKKLNIK